MSCEHFYFIANTQFVKYFVCQQEFVFNDAAKRLEVSPLSPASKWNVFLSKLF